jgi:hypothetical protein
LASGPSSARLTTIPADPGKSCSPQQQQQLPAVKSTSTNRPSQNKRYWSNVLLQTDSGGETVKCAWLDGDGGQPTTGIQIHWPEFDGNGGAVQDGSYYCENNPSLRFLTEPDPTSISFWTPARRMFARDPSVATSSSSSADPAVEGQRRAADDQYERLRRQMAGDDRLVKSSKAVHSAVKLCGAKRSVGPDFVSRDERKFCEMKSKTLYDFCEEAEAGEECWDDEENVLTKKTAGVSALDFAGDGGKPVSKYGDVVSWE